MFRRVVCVVLAWLLIMPPSSLLAWSEGGHQIVGYLAFDAMDAQSQTRLLAILKSHPKFATDFRTDLSEPKAVGRFMLGTAAYWPDVARDYAEYNRPNWHYQPGPALIIGNPANVPASPGPLPVDATLATRDLHIEQAIELCRKTLRDAASDSDKAIAICWLAHLVGDAHQPCHAGSLYAEGVFPDGDRGANSIPTKQKRNLHALWDGLLGTSGDPTEVSRRVFDIQQNSSVMAAAKAAEQDLKPATWLSESVEKSLQRVYTAEVLDAVEAARRAGTKVGVIDLSAPYLKDAGAVAQERIAVAGLRLAKLLSEDLR